MARRSEGDSIPVYIYSCGYDREIDCSRKQSAHWLYAIERERGGCSYSSRNKRGSNLRQLFINPAINIVLICRKTSRLIFNRWNIDNKNYSAIDKFCNVYFCAKSLRMYMEKSRLCAGNTKINSFFQRRAVVRVHFSRTSIDLSILRGSCAVENN